MTTADFIARSFPLPEGALTPLAWHRDFAGQQFTIDAHDNVFIARKYTHAGRERSTDWSVYLNGKWILVSRKLDEAKRRVEVERRTIEGKIL